MGSVADDVRQTLASNAVRNCSVCVALSGGVDSVVLLDLLHGLSTDLSLRLSALHVHHGLSPRADEWEAFCRSLCSQRAISFSSVRVAVDRNTGIGVEAAARMVRYEVFARSDADYVALGHHLDDQVETFLLQLLRGAGPKGLSAMPVVRDPGWAGAGRRRGALLRPLLPVSRAQIEEYARTNGQQWVEDESNRNTDLDRNFLRHEVLPVLASRFPAYRETLSRAARNMAAAAAIVDTLAEMDRRAIEREGGFSVRELREIPIDRALNVLRLKLAEADASMPPRSRLEEALRQCLAAAPDAQMCVRFGSWELRRYRDMLALVPQQSAAGDWSARWEGEASLALPGGLGNLQFIETIGEGVAAARMRSAPVVVRFRQGGERFEPAGRPRRQLKKLWQESGVPTWERRRIPLLFSGDVLIWAPGLGVAGPYQAQAGESGVRVEWEPALIDSRPEEAE
jgi:tRNA(Ile)-lysidine synthase